MNAPLDSPGFPTFMFLDYREKQTCINPKHKKETCSWSRIWNNNCLPRKQPSFLLHSVSFWVFFLCLIIWFWVIYVQWALPYTVNFCGYYCCQRVAVLVHSFVFSFIVSSSLLCLNLFSLDCCQAFWFLKPLVLV